MGLSVGNREVLGVGGTEASQVEGGREAQHEASIWAEGPRLEQAEKSQVEWLHCHEDQTPGATRATVLGLPPARGCMPLGSGQEPSAPTLAIFHVCPGEKDPGAPASVVWHCLGSVQEGVPRFPAHSHTGVVIGPQEGSFRPSTPPFLGPPSPAPGVRCVIHGTSGTLCLGREGAHRTW